MRPLRHRTVSLVLPSLFLFAGRAQHFLEFFLPYRLPSSHSVETFNFPVFTVNAQQIGLVRVGIGQHEQILVSVSVALDMHPADFATRGGEQIRHEAE